MTPPILLAVPNVSEGRDMRAIDAIGDALAGPAGAGDAAQASSHALLGDGAPASSVRLLDVHSDADHDRSVYTIAGPPGELADALLRGAEAAVRRVDVMGRTLGAGSPRAREQLPPGQPPPSLLLRSTRLALVLQRRPCPRPDVSGNRLRTAG